MNLFVVGDRISYLERTGIVMRTRILGMSSGSSIQIKWDDNGSQTILQSYELNDVVKL